MELSLSCIITPNPLSLCLDYIADRLNNFDDLKPLATWFRAAFDPLKNVPRYLVPCYFDAIVSGVYNVLVQQVTQLMPR